MGAFSILFAYFAGTLVGIFMGYGQGVRTGASDVVEKLIKTGCLRTRESSSGDVEILPLEDLE